MRFIHALPLFKHPTSGTFLLVFCLLILFFALYDASYSFMVPVVLDEAGFSKTVLGLILASSSGFGAVFDFWASKYFASFHFRRVLALMLLSCLFAPLILWHAGTIWLYLLAMFNWGFYYDLLGLGTADFVSRKTDRRHHAGSFGVIWVFRALGYTLAPLILSFLPVERHDPVPYFVMWVFIIIAILFFVLLLFLHKEKPKENLPTREPKRHLKMGELALWIKIGKLLFPTLSLIALVWMVEAFFWTIGPLVVEDLSQTFPLGGLFLTLFSLPALLSGWMVGKVTTRYGKKKTAIFSFILASIGFLTIFFIHQPILLLVCVFISAFAFSFTFPAIDGAFADYIEESPAFEREIITLQDFFYNFGFVAGPILAGIAADLVGNKNTFGVLGVIGVIAGTLLYLATPKKIHVSLKHL